MAILKSHLGVYGLIFNDAGTHILTIKKGRGDAYLGRYDLPGGAMEEGELLEETLRREILEETSCTVTDLEQLGAFSTLHDFTAKDGTACCLRHIGVIYITEIEGIPSEQGDGQDSLGCHWLSLDDATDPATTTPLMRMALAEWDALTDPDL